MLQDPFNKTKREIEGIPDASMSKFILITKHIVITGMILCNVADS